MTALARFRQAASMLLVCACLAPRGGTAQDLEPRQYSNIPAGLNFLVAGYGTSEGGVVVDPSIALENAEIRVDGPIVGYARGLALAGLSAKVDAGIGHVCIDGSAELDGQRVARNVCGWTDLRTRLAVNFIGAPGLRPQEFAAYRQDLIVGASLQLSVPVGDYDEPNLVNIGANRWAVRTEIGVSKALNRWTLELALGGTFYQTNDEFRSVHRREQDPIYSLQAHAVYGFASGIWMAVDLTQYRGGETTTDGLANRNMQSNSRFGLTVSAPINRAQSVKLYYSSGVATRTGTDFDTFGAAWQYRWGGSNRDDRG